MRSCRASVVLLAAPGTLSRLEEPLRSAGVELTRVETVHPVAIPPSQWLPALLKLGPVDSVVVTSRFAVGAGVVPWRRGTHPGREVRYWAVGPVTAATLRSRRIPNVRRPGSTGANAVVRAIGQGRSTILHLRSDRAGPGMARMLRAQGHRVRDVVTYRTLNRTELSRSEVQRIREADLLIATSPSSIDAFRGALGRAVFREIAVGTPLVVLGSRSETAARRAGFRRVSTAASRTARSFTRHLLNEIDHA